MRDNTRHVLELFVEKAELLEARNFYKFIAEHGVSLNVTWTAGQPIETQTLAPDDEALAALMVTFRMFIQDNDSISLRNLPKLMGDPGLSANWVAQVNDARRVVNEHLDRRSSAPVIYDTIPLTYREILETFVYGDIAHTSPKKREQFLEWKRNDLAFQFLKYSFNEAVLSLLDAVKYISDMTKLETAGQPVPPLPTDEERAEMDA